MNSKSSLLAALVAGVLPLSVIAQAAPAAPAAPAAVPAVPAEAKLPPPSAFPAKIALVNFIGAVEETNEGQKVAMDLQAKYQPKKDKLEALATEIDTLKKQLQAAPATTTDEERNRRLKEIDTKDKQYQRDAEDASNAYQADMNDGLQKVAAKVHETMVNYVAKNGYTLLFDYGGQQSPLIWAAQDQNADITEAVIQAYNASSGVAAPAPAAPTAGAGAARRPAAGSGTGKSGTTPRSPAPAK
jgi:Skp family chaperone for outer membrane proteins